MKTRSSDLIVIAIAKAKPGKESELAEALREVAGPTRAQPGCVQFSLYRAKGAPAAIVGFERWASEADHERHLKGAHVEKLMGRMTPVLAEPPSIIAYEVIED